MLDAIGRVPVDVVETEWLRLSRGEARYVFRGDSVARLAAGSVLGATLAPSTGRAVTCGARAALALGPDEQLFIVPEGEAAMLQSRLATELAGRPHSLVDVSHRQVGLQLVGRHAAWLLAAGCPLPLEIEVFPVDACTRSLFGKAEIVLWRIGPEAIRLEVARSFCQYVVGLLHEAAAEV
jgi:sarcosine oxidase subunit gamma